MATSQRIAGIPRPFGNNLSPSCVLLGDSVLGYYNYPITVTSVTGANGVCSVNAAFQPVLDGTRLNLTCPGASFDQKVAIAASIDVNDFSFSDAYIGAGAPPVVACYTQGLLSDRGIFTWANRLMGHKFRVLNSGCFGGNTTAQMLARFQRDVAAYGPTHVFVMGGINDAAGGFSPASIFANLTTIYEMAAEAAIIPVALTILPLHASHPAFATANPILQAVNSMIKSFCRQNDIPCIDTYAAWVDPTQSSGAGVAAYYNASQNDFVHPVPYSAYIAAQPIVNFFSALPVPPLLVDGPNDNNNLNSVTSSSATVNAANTNIFPYGPFTATGGTVAGTGTSGVLPSGWATSVTGTGTCVCSVPARTVGTDGDAIGNNVQLVLTPGGSYTLTLSAADLTAQCVPGGTYQILASLRISGAAASNLYNIGNTQLINNGTKYGYVGANQVDTTFSPPQYHDGSWIIATPEFTMPPWATAGVAPQFAFAFSATSGNSLTANIGRVTVRRVA